MNNLPNVVIVMARCCQTRQSFGIRFEEKVRGQWTAYWAFPIKEASAKKEGYDTSEISGLFGFDSAYPRCPYCSSATLFKCSCGKVACWDGEHRKVICPWCRNKVELDSTVESLSVGKDR
jgi:hypothetical protein